MGSRVPLVSRLTVSIPFARAGRYWMITGRRCFCGYATDSVVYPYIALDLTV